jgi:hypothetical protein
MWSQTKLFYDKSHMRERERERERERGVHVNTRALFPMYGGGGGGIMDFSFEGEMSSS